MSRDAVTQQLFAEKLTKNGLEAKFAMYRLYDKTLPIPLSIWVT